MGQKKTKRKDDMTLDMVTALWNPMESKWKRKLTQEERAAMLAWAEALDKMKLKPAAQFVRAHLDVYAQ